MQLICVQRDCELRNLFVYFAQTRQQQYFESRSSWLGRGEKWVVELHFFEWMRVTDTTHDELFVRDGGRVLFVHIEVVGSWKKVWPNRIALWANAFDRVRFGHAPNEPWTSQNFDPHSSFSPWTAAHAKYVFDGAQQKQKLIKLPRGKVCAPRKSCACHVIYWAFA